MFSNKKILNELSLLNNRLSTLITIVQKLDSKLNKKKAGRPKSDAQRKQRPRSAVSNPAETKK